MSAEEINRAIVTATRLIDELREAMDIYSYEEEDMQMVFDAAKAATNLQQENEQLKELLQLAVVDMNQSDNCDVCKVNDYMPSCDCECLECSLECECQECRNASHFTWKRADRLKGLIEI